MSLGDMLMMSAGDWRGQRHLISPKLKLQPAVSNPMWVPDTKVASSAKATSALNH